jgi:3'(2'), 5'-bisphosphate nucleotidase
MEDRALLDLAFDLARRAGETILAIRARGFETTRKADASVVTEADHAAEALILAGLRDAAPGIPVVAEEDVAAGHVAERAECYWLVDPLDGTREFSTGGDDFAVCIGLVRDHRPVLGVVSVPVAGEVFGGLLGVGAWKRGAAGETPIAARRPPRDGLAVLASRNHNDDQRLAAFLADRKVASVTQFGSAVKFCWLADGRADLYPRFGRTMEWDTAAAQALLEAAGGSVRDLAGAPFRYGKPGWENPGFVATGRA